MAAGTVAYVDTRGNKDYLGMVASQIGKRVKQASNMAREERAFAAKRAEEQGTSLEEAGIGKGYFFKRALGSRFGGDKIARTRGRFESDPPAGRDPTKNYKQRFRGGFDYKVTNEINSLASNAIVPMSSALSAGLRGVEGGLTQVSQSIASIGDALGQLATTQNDMAREVMMMGAFMRAFMSYMQRQQSRASANREERGIESGIRSLPGSSGGGIAGLLPGSGGSGGGLKGLKDGGDFAKTLARRAASGGKYTAKGVAQGGKLATTAIKSGSVVLAKGGVQAPLKITQAILKNQNRIAARASEAIFGSRNATAITKQVVKQGTLGTKVGAEAIQQAALTGKALSSGGGAAAAANSVKPLSKVGRGVYQTSNLTKAQAAGVFAQLKDAGIPEDKIMKEMMDTFGKETVEELTQQGAKRALKSAKTAKFAASMTGKGLAKSALKKIPIVAGLAGIVFGIQRALEGDFFGAGLEIASGVMGATGVGAGASLGIDGFLLARDMGVVPFAEGGIVTGRRPVNALIGETGKSEAVIPLDDKTFIRFGEGILEAQKDNKTDYGKVQAEGLKTYYEKQNGWGKWWTGFKEFLSKLPVIGHLFRDGDDSDNTNNEFNDPLSGARRFAAGLVGGYDKLDPTAAGSGLGTYGTGLKTGPSSKIGGSSAYHIDSQFKSSLSMEEKVKMMDDLAAAYAARGRKIEFSNNAVAGQVWNSESSMEEKMALLQKAFEAHQIPRGREVDAGGFNRIDYYIPKIEENRFGASAEGAEILVPTRGATTMDYAQGGDYGAFVNLKDKDGNVIFRTGHGDVRGARSGSVDLSKAKSASPTTGLNLGPQSALPSTDQNFMQKWLASVGLAEKQSASLYQKSAITSMAPQLAAPTIITNNYYGSGSPEATTDTTFSSGFGTSSLSTFALPYSLASK